MSTEKYLSLFACILAVFFSGVTSAAGTLTGDIGVKLEIGDGCTVSNGSTSGGVNQWGTLDFGTHPDLTSVIDGSITGSGGSGTVTIACNAGLSPTLSLDGGLYSDGSLRSVSSDGGTTLIGYRLYSDSARSNEIAINASIPLIADGTPQDVPVYGRVLPSDQGSTAPASGTYTDTVIATMTW